MQLPSPIAFESDGTLVDTGSPSSLTAGRSRRPRPVANATVGRIARPLDLVVDPLLVTQARDLFDGYRTRDGTECGEHTGTAGGELPALAVDRGVVAGAVETVANPYANPLLPAMLQAQLTSPPRRPAARW